MKCKTDGLRNSGIPLGGLGTGSVELRRDGLFHEWQIMNNAPWGPGPKATIPEDALFFGLQINGKENKSAVLASPSDLSGWLMEPYLLPWLERPTEIQSTARFPFTELAYDFATLPVNVSLEAFSPFIPLDAKNSGLPLAYLTFSIENRSKETLPLTFFGCMANMVGYSADGALSVMDAECHGKQASISFRRKGISNQQSDYGSMALGMIADTAGTTSYGMHIRHRDLWDVLRESGRLENHDFATSKGAPYPIEARRRARLRKEFRSHGALARSMKLKPGETTRLTFILCWHFPVFIERDCNAKNKPGSNIGHQYANWFKDANGVLDYAVKNAGKLRRDTKAFFDAYYSSTMEPWLLDAISAQMTTLVKSSWWDKQGRFGIWEGLGCCGLQTTDITHYGSFPIVQFFPEIEKSQMRLTKDNVEKPGDIPHMMPGTFACSDVDNLKRIDLMPQFVLLVWRDVLWTGDLKYLREMWQTVKDAMAYMDTKDLDGDGLPNNTGADQTYDQFPMKGTSAFVGILFLGSLRAAAEMAELVGETDYACEMRKRFTSAEKLLDEQLWTGAFYRLCYDPVTGKSNDGVMTDQINGDWFIRQTTGTSLLENRKVKSSLQAILDACSHPAGFIANCAWPKGGGSGISRLGTDQAGTPWSGVEYAVAAHMILLGMENAGIKVARDVWDRYESVGERFNHIECGGHYYRALSSWAVYLALSGWIVDVLNRTLKLRIGRKPMRSVLTTADAWGVLNVDGKTISLEIRSGALKLKTIEVSGKRFEKARVTINNKAIQSEVAEGSISLGRVATLKIGDVLNVHL
jgi:non-lysosomal glucosylceramidase